MFEHRKHALLPRREFIRQLGWSVAAGAVLIAFSLNIGMLGYHYLAGLAWIDAFLDAAMILSGMGPLSPLQTEGGKIFAGCYALFSGLAFFAILGIIFAPAVHRFLHRFHVDEAKRNAKLPDQP